MTRLDIELVKRKLVHSRSQAQTLIEEGAVLVNDKIITKTSKDVSEKESIILTEKLKYVSRGGYKLEAGLQNFGLTSLTEFIILDIGSSTGGFTDCVLQMGAKQVYSVDVGTGQFSEFLKSDSRVVLMEQTDIRNIEKLPTLVDLIVIDVSFISLEHIIPILSRFLKKGGSVVALVKPQFEVGKGNLNRQGIVTDVDLYKVVEKKILNCFIEHQFTIEDYRISPIIGGSGNSEYLLCATYK
jgi:23S rRNA (cytidine1920-2'-O)/16S rRNA (cytidine1409-2'-O)-methyltransferase